jgi:hypothetical protein
MKEEEAYPGEFKDLDKFDPHIFHHSLDTEELRQRRDEAIADAEWRARDPEGWKAAQKEYLGKLFGVILLIVVLCFAIFGLSALMSPYR